ncbi:hypothetical protein Bca52824_042628 [Brassica carinata]|uniref:NOG1 N-terminal helical domain-containing protein n=1 Tax=Brassica carinata TaxID=52824 RepID=A0A8X7S1Z1_BRACI|nr:hypothetical protein Bca52824_042628 [Brassica carinata]
MKMESSPLCNRRLLYLSLLSSSPVSRGYWGNKIGKPHTVPCKVTGKCGFVTVRMVPAPEVLVSWRLLASSTTNSPPFWSPTLRRQYQNLQTAVSHIVVTSSYLPTSYITQANIAKRERNRGAKQLDALMKELALPLKGYMEIFPRRRLLHPYERSLIELTLGDGKYEEVLGKVDAKSKKVLSVGKEHASLCAKALSKREVEDRLSEGVEKLELVFQQQGRDVDDLLSIAKLINHK